MLRFSSATLLFAAAAVCVAGRAVPRHIRDKRCLGAVRLDPSDKRRDPSSTSQYLFTPMATGSSAQDCAHLCCGDWSCESFDFYADGKGVSGCEAGRACCVFRDDVDPLVPSSDPTVTSGVRGKLPARRPAYPNSSIILSAKIDPKLYIAVQGDEFPITWGADGAQYTGAGDNNQGPPDDTFSQAAFFRVEGGPETLGCTDESGPSPHCKNLTLQGAEIPIRGKYFLDFCDAWRTDIYDDVPNVKSNAVLSVEGVLYWVVGCFNYGDDDDFNRQRYGPTWIITSKDGGVTWDLNATKPGMFTGRLAAPRFVQYGRDYAGAPDDFVYVHFPATAGGAAFFSANDMMFLGRVNKTSILDRSAYEFYAGTEADGDPSWVSDDTLAAPVFTYPLMTSVQQVNYHARTKRYVFANWAWISYDGHPRPDHSPDERNPRTVHQRTQLTLFEAPTPYGPFSLFYLDDDWRASDGSSGGYTPVFPPAWMGDEEFWVVSTQCCNPFPRSPPDNHYTFNAQHVTLKLNRSALPLARQ